MKKISFKTHGGEDGTLQISLPPELKNADLKVTLVYQSISLNDTIKLPNPQKDISHNRLI
jgi:hypothetical protein